MALQALGRPATSVTCAVLGGIYGYITAKGIGYEQVGLSHEKALGRWEMWRVVTGERHVLIGLSPSSALTLFLTEKGPFPSESARNHGQSSHIVMPPAS